MEANRKLPTAVSVARLDNFPPNGDVLILKLVRARFAGHLWKTATVSGNTANRVVISHVVYPYNEFRKGLFVYEGFKTAF